ncbi:hypothetical protein V3C99_001338 [Haemonchus contortus]
MIFALSTCSLFAYARKRAVCANKEMSDAIRSLILDFHNDARRRVAKGQEPNKVGMLNPAKNMYKLEWDCTMEQQAQDAIVNCPGTLGTWPNTAQNIMRWSTSGRFSNPIAQVKSSLDKWWGEFRKVGVSDAENKYTTGALYNFANMVFSETSKIGCAYKICGGTTLVFTCLYNGIGYVSGEPMWETGTACSTGSDCTTFPNSGCDDGLCTKGTPVPETNNMCPSNSGMTDSVRRKFLDMHNQYRSSLARGPEPDGFGGNAPKAARMLKMVYDCSAEATAMKHASKCTLRHSKSSERPGLGENVFETTALKLDKVKAAAQASKLWWDELKEYGVGPSNNLTAALFYRPNTKIGHYTQMAWETSYRLGCAIAHCPSFTYGVCHYGPAGNIINRLIYTIGNPCTGCPGSYTCSVSEGLCNVV